jgi:hypothetical protein
MNIPLLCVSDVAASCSDHLTGEQENVITSAAMSELKEQIATLKKELRNEKRGHKGVVSSQKEILQM